MKAFLERHYPEVGFGGYTSVDGSILFYDRVRSMLRPDSVLLDVGCGRGQYIDDMVDFRRRLRIFKGDVKSVIGIDPDPIGEENPFLDEFRLMGSTEDGWPIEDGSVDVCLTDYVLEHVKRPEPFFDECRRVLRPGGVLCIRTSNLFSYVGLASRVIPEAFHGRVLGRAQPHRRSEDVFPAWYACNTVGRLRRAMKCAGFLGFVKGHHPEPSYLSFSAVAYALGVVYQRVMPTMFAPTIHAFGRKSSG